MTMNGRHQSWLDIAALDEHLTVFLKLDEALERFLADIASFSREPYKINTDSGSVQRSSPAQISNAVDSLGGSLNVLDVWYAGPSCRVSLDVRPFAAHPLYRIGCALYVYGDDEQLNNGGSTLFAIGWMQRSSASSLRPTQRRKPPLRQPQRHPQQPRQALAVSGNG